MLIYVGWGDTALGAANLIGAPGLFFQTIQQEVIWHHHMGAFADTQM